MTHSSRQQKRKEDTRRAVLRCGSGFLFTKYTGILLLAVFQDNFVLSFSQKLSLLSLFVRTTTCSTAVSYSSVFLFLVKNIMPLAAL